MRNIFGSSGLGPVAVLAGGGASALLLALTAGPGSATTTLTVDTLTDGVANATDCSAPVIDSCSLRDAIAAAADGDVIVFEAGLVGTSTLTEGKLFVEVGLTITGAGSDLLTIDADGNSGVFYIGSAASDVTVSGMRITGGGGNSTTGAGIDAYNSGSLDLVDVDVSGNAASYGGGVYATGTGSFSMTDSTVSNNTAGVGAGGLYLAGSLTDVLFTRSVISGNTASQGGGGIVSYNSGDVALVDSRVTGNTSSTGGGGKLMQGGNLVVDGSVFDGNTALGGGGIYSNNVGSVTITDSTFSENTVSGNAGGGALYFATTGQEILISNSTFESNSGASWGGALDFDADDQVVVINNSTIVGNTASRQGGGIWKETGGSLTINQSTITENDAAIAGGGIFLTAASGGTAAATVVLSGSIVSANTATTNPDGTDISLVWTAGDSFSSDHSLLGDVTDGVVVIDLGGNITSDTPGLSPLADNGGATLTMALLANSVAIDAGPDSVATFAGNGFDQRGTPWVRVYNGLVDIGAYEVQPDPTPTTTTTTQDPTTTTTEGPTPTTTEPTDTTIATGETVVPAFTG